MSKQTNKVPLLKVIEFAEKFGSTGTAFILATLGVITQTFHNGFLFFQLSSFDNFWLNLIQTTIGAFGLSGALLYFTIRASNGGSKVVKQLVWLFFAFEIYANIYYWANKYVISVWGTEAVNWSSMIIAIPFAIMIPFTIKAYAGELNFTEALKAIRGEGVNEGVNEGLNEAVNEAVNDALNDSDIVRQEQLNVFAKSEDLEGLAKTEDLEGLVKTDDLDAYIKDGEMMNLNIKTTDSNGNQTTKVLPAIMNKSEEVPYYISDSNGGTQVNSTVNEEELEESKIEVKIEDQDEAN